VAFAAFATALGAWFLVPTDTLSGPKRGPDPSPAKAGVDDTPRAGTRLSRAWNFDSRGSFDDLKPSIGTWRHVPGNGFDGSGCVFIEKQRVSLPLPGTLGILPLKISVRVQRYGPGPHLTGVDMSELSAVARFLNFGRKPPIPAREACFDSWRRAVFYVSEQVVRWMEDDGYNGVFAFERHGDSCVCLMLSGTARIDDLTVEEIDRGHLPDASPWLEAYRRVRGSARPGAEFVIPELREFARPGEKIILRFMKRQGVGSRGEGDEP
jgi:hypothetical protein